MCASKCVEYRDDVQAQPAQEVPLEARRGLRVPAFLAQWRAAIAAAPAFDRSSPIPTWIGLGLVGAGFAVLAYGWGKVAGLAAVALQVPYIISAGCIGLGLIVLGAAVVAIQGRRREAAARADVLVELGRVMREIERLTADGRGDR
jgi:hypothetical protein